MASRDFAFGAPTLHDLTAALASAGSIDDVAAEILELGAYVIGACSAHLSVVVQPGWRRDFSSQPDVHARGEETPVDRPIALDTPLSRALLTRRPQVFESRDEYRATFPHLARELEKVAARTAITVPLHRSDGDVIGALTYGFVDDGPMPPARRTLAAQIAEQGALALDRAVLLHREREAARQALRLHGVSTELAGVAHLSELAAVLQRAGREALGATNCHAYVVGEDSQLLLVGTDASETGDPPAPDVLPEFANPVRDAFIRNDLVVVESRAQLLSRYGDAAWPTAGMIAAPLRVGTRAIGVLHASFDTMVRFTPELRSLVAGFAEHVALAVDRSVLSERAEAQAAITERERDRLIGITTALQDGLFTTGSDGRMVDANDRFCEITGYPRDEVIGAVPPYPWWPRGHEATSQRFISSIVARLTEPAESGPGEFDVAFEHPDGSRVLGLLTASPLHDSSGAVVGVVGTVKDVTARVLAERRIRVLQAITARLGAARTVRDVAHATIEEALPALHAQAGGFFVLDRDKRVIELLHSHEIIEGTGTRWPQVSLDIDAGVTEAMRERRLVVSDIHTASSVRRAQLEMVGATRGIWVPVCVGDDEVATAGISLLFRDDRPTPDEDLALFTAIGQQCAQAIERAFAAEAEHRARVEAERSIERTRTLQEATAALTIASEPSEVARAVWRHAGALVGAYAVALFAVDREQQELVLIDTGAYADDARALQVMRLPLDAPFSLADAARTQQPVWIFDSVEWRERYPLGAQTLGSEFEALVVLPLVAAGETLAVLAMVFKEPLRIDDDDRSVLYTLRDLTAHALHRAARFASEREVARTLQESLLPHLGDVTEQCRVAARYRPAVDQLQIGGDWYDALAGEPNHLVLTVGDVVGRGVSAAAAMGQLRSALGSLSLSNNAPGRVLDLLDRFVYRIDGGESATVAYAVLDVVTGVLRYACAGHPPPLVLEPAAAPRFLEDGRSWPLGIGQAPRPRPDAATRLRPGTAVVLYTDGLVEQRKVPLDERLAALADAAGAGPVDDPAVVCDRLLAAMLVGEQPDDVALLTVVYDPALASDVHWTIPATPTSIREARGVVRRWLERRGMTPDEAFDLVLAADEACANAVEHGSRGPDDMVELTMYADDDDAVVITVSDQGRWVPRVPRPHRGQGFVLMKALMSSVEVDASDDGTRVRLRRR